jgi:hypothetical protein
MDSKMLSYSTDKQATPVTVASKKNCPMRPLEDRTQQTDIPNLVDNLLILLLHLIFSGSVHAAVSVDSTLQFKGVFTRPNSEIRKTFSFIMHVQKPPTKFHSMSCILLVHCMKQSWYVEFPLLMPKNVTNTGLRDTNLTGTLPYRLL